MPIASKITLFSTPKQNIGVNVCARYIVEGDRRIELAVIVNDNTTAEQLRSCWPNIDQMRAQLIDVQGSDLTVSLAALARNKYYYAKTGMSPADVAMETNYECLVQLCYVVLCEAKDDKHGVQDGMRSAFAQLRSTRMKAEDCMSWIIDGLVEIRSGNAPWTLTRGPSSGPRIREFVRQYERELKGKKIVLGPRSLAGAKLVSLEDISNLECNQYRKPKEVEVADELLSKEPDQGGLAKLKSAIERHMSSQGNSG